MVAAGRLWGCDPPLSCLDATAPANCTFRRCFTCRNVVSLGGSFAIKANPLHDLEHGCKDAPIALVRIVVLLQLDNRHGVGGVFLDLRRDVERQLLHGTLATKRCHALLSFHLSVFAVQASPAAGPGQLPAKAQ